MIGVSSPGNSYSLRRSRTSISTSSSKLFVFNHVAFVQEYDDVRYAYLTGKQDVLTSLWHRAVSCGYNQDRSVHLCSTSDHVLNIVSVSWAVNVCIVTVGSFVLNVSCGDCDTALALFWSFVDLVVCYCSYHRIFWTVQL